VRRIFFWFGVLAAAFTVVVIVGFGYLAYNGSRLDKESESYANAAVLGGTSHWNGQELLGRATPNLLRSATAAQISSMFEWFSVLGPLTDSQDCKGSSSVVAFVGKPISTLARYTCQAQYQQGSATISMVLVKIGDVWMLNAFHVDSPILMTRKPPQKS